MQHQSEPRLGEKTTRRVIVLGGGSFLCGSWLRSQPPFDIVHIGRIESIPDSALEQADVAINFAAHPDMEARLLHESEMPEWQLAARLREHSTHLIQLSSRRVYGRKQGPLFENDPIAPTTTGGKNKSRSEELLLRILPATKVTVLRLGNVFGAEYTGRKTFAGQALNSLFATGEIHLTMREEAYKDFLPDYIFASLLNSVLMRLIPGAFNVGSGIPTPVGDFARWLVDGYGRGTVRASPAGVDDSFVLDIARIASLYHFECAASEIHEYCRYIGKGMINVED